MKKRVFDILARASKGYSGEGGGKLAAITELGPNGKPTGTVWRKPDEVLERAHEYGVKAHRASTPHRYEGGA